MMIEFILSLAAAAELEDVALADICGDDAVCYETEASARSRLTESWETFPEAMRETCLERQEEPRSYRQLEACLIIETVMSAPQDTEQTEARIDLRPVSIQGSIHAD